MKALDPKIIEILNEVLTGELTAINQYFLHAQMCKNWGFNKLYEKVYHESIDEMKHAQSLIDRVLFLDGVPNLQRLGKLHIGESVKEQFESDLALENVAIPRLREGIKFARQVGDDGTRDLLEQILIAEEEHVDWLEAQLELIEQIGLQNYLAQQL